MNQEFTNLINSICSSLFEGEIWHERSGGECRKIAVRGWGRWHDHEAKGDMCSRMCIEKLLRDKCDYSPTIDVGVATRAMSYSIPAVGSLKEHLTSWIAREEQFINTLNQAIKIAATVDIDIYKCLIDLTAEVQAEKMRVNLCVKRLDVGQWGGHDISIVSMILHEFFEKNDGDDLKYVNVNLG